MGDKVKAGMCIARFQGQRKKIKGGEDSESTYSHCEFVVGLWLKREARELLQVHAYLGRLFSGDTGSGSRNSNSSSNSNSIST